MPLSRPTRSSNAGKKRLMVVCLLLLVDCLLAQNIPLKKIESHRKRLLRTGNWNPAHAAAAHNEPMGRFGPWHRGGPPSRITPPNAAATTTTKAAVSSLSIDTAGDAEIYDYYDLEYMAVVSLGTPAQNFQVIPDTGSSNFWVVDSSCKSGGVGCGKKRYFHIEYGSGSASGSFGQDAFQFAGLSFSVIFGQASSIGSAFDGIGTDGILGLGGPALVSAQGIKLQPALYQATEQGALPSGEFTVFLGSDDDSACSGSQITLGEFDTQNCDASTLSWVSLTSDSYWQFNLNEFTVGTYTYANTTSAISDTGTSLIYGPNVVVENAAKQVGATFSNTYQMYMMSCSTSGLPNLNFQINGVNFSILPTRYVFEADGNQCGFALTPMGQQDGPAWILGDTFLRDYCATYDYDNSRVGFSQTVC